MLYYLFIIIRSIRADRWVTKVHATEIAVLISGVYHIYKKHHDLGDQGTVIGILHATEIAEC